ncbi:Noc2-domain-containing protein [Coniophora puteana RWD-64-598 SS2]|uniref:Noc2-domain-containing protein n=1 Tax=Coniophora puteana (strain RWD-64-598) TaxID=741705 RepID=A0A5M3MCA2_CONPW|nr:Noc2-domain-containing protein [Coniophora puteana RWD-64-598 SS2]EIW76677.1 Noc2-domain-containing protein [Coniophora puteana RWD-64-598 SS2]
MGKAAKSTRKFKASGQLKKTIEIRKKAQAHKKKIESRRGAKGKNKPAPVNSEDGTDNEEEGEPQQENGKKGGKSAKGMSVDDFLGADFMDEDGDDDEADGSDADDDEDLEDIPDDQSFASVDDLEDEGQAHMFELSKLAEQDPEFYKYLQENDRELLEFDPEGADQEDEGEDEDEEMGDAEDEKLPVLTLKLLRSWQKLLIEQRSLKVLRKLLIAFRSAARTEDEDQGAVWSIDNAEVYSKLVSTALRYTPVVLEHHAPYKTLANGKFKPPTQTTKQKTLSKLVLSYFYNIIHVLSQLTDNDTLTLAITESAKLLPYVITSRKAVKLYLKKCLELWSTADDHVRIAAFSAIRRLASSSDDSIMDMVLKGTYLELVRSCKSTTAHKLPFINLMKNCAAELFCIDHASSYQLAFGYIRQLAIHLRNSMKNKTKEAYKQVYNWQYVHCVDFWTLVLSKACNAQTFAERGGEESELKALVYPLVQVSLGAMKLVSNSRTYPFHIHISRSMLHLTQHTRTFIPLSPYLVPILTGTLSSSSKPKSSTLRPLEFDTNIRAPSQYLKTKVYTEGLVEEACFVLAEWLSSPSIQGSVAFPEIVVPVVVALRKGLKTAKSKSKGAGGKETGIVKNLVERIEESSRWVEQARKGLTFGPGKMGDVEAWEAEVKVANSPLGKYVGVQRKAREKKSRLVEKARKGEDEILDE